MQTKSCYSNTQNKGRNAKQVVVKQHANKGRNANQVVLEQHAKTKGVMQNGRMQMETGLWSL
jgi:hypothetical protein